MCVKVCTCIVCHLLHYVLSVINSRVACVHCEYMCVCCVCVCVVCVCCVLCVCVRVCVRVCVCVCVVCVCHQRYYSYSKILKYPLHQSITSPVISLQLCNVLQSVNMGIFQCLGTRKTMLSPCFVLCYNMEYFYDNVELNQLIVTFI